MVRNKRLLLLPLLLEKLVDLVMALPATKLLLLPISLVPGLCAFSIRYLAIGYL